MAGKTRSSTVPQDNYPWVLQEFLKGAKPWLIQFPKGFQLSHPRTHKHKRANTQTNKRTHTHTHTNTQHTNNTHKQTSTHTHTHIHTCKHKHTCCQCYERIKTSPGKALTIQCLKIISMLNIFFMQLSIVCSSQSAVWIVGFGVSTPGSCEAPTSTNANQQMALQGSKPRSPPIPQDKMDQTEGFTPKKQKVPAF